MSLVGFGQPDDGIIQMCYLVPDIRAAMSLWIDKLKVAPGSCSITSAAPTPSTAAGTPRPTCRSP